MAGKRAHRHTLCLPVRFRAAGAETDPSTGHTTNVSASGMFIAARHCPRVATLVDVVVIRESDSLEILGEVVRVTKPSASTLRGEPGGFAIRFSRPDEHSVRSLVEQWQQFTTRQFQSRAMR